MVYILITFIMAITSNGFYNNPNGKIGKMVYYMLNGQLVSRSIGKQGKPTKPQLANRQKMAVTMEVIRDMLGFINEGFKLEAAGTTKNPFNLATSYNKKHAVIGEYPYLSLDYSKLLLSSGKLNAPLKTGMVKTETGIQLSWDGYNDKNFAKDDMAMIMLYFPSQKKTKTTHIFYAAQRDKGQHFIPLTKDDLDRPIEAYMFFKSADSKAVSDSVYLGNLNGIVVSKAEILQKEVDQAAKDRFKVVEDKYLAAYHSLEGAGKKKADRQLRMEYNVLKARFQEPPEDND